MGNDLINISLAKVSSQFLQNQLEAFTGHISEHFLNEETILSQVHYPDLENHRIIHSMLLEEAEIVKNRFLGGKIDPSLIFHLLVDRIVLDHMLTEDVKFFTYTKRI